MMELSLNSPARFRPYAPRTITFDGLLDHDGWRIKTYGVVHDDGALGEDMFARGVATALDALPAAHGPGRPGLAFIIRHRGAGMNYVILSWWDHENELPTRVFVDGGNGWRPADTESFCVWDLQIIGFERDAYVRRILADPANADADAYLEDAFTTSPE